MALLPASTAGLPASRPCVRVGPPLSASGAIPGLATPVWLLFVPFDKPPAPPVPTRLNELAVTTEPAISSAVVVALPLKLPATRVLFIVKLPETTLMPPPAPTPALSFLAWLLVIVTFVRAALPPLSLIAPASLELRFPENVVFLTTRLPKLMARPAPPRWSAEVFEVTLASTRSS